MVALSLAKSKPNFQIYSLKWLADSSSAVVEGKVFTTPDELWNFLSHRADVALENGDISIRTKVLDDHTPEEVKEYLARNGRVSLCPPGSGIRSLEEEKKRNQRKLAKHISKAGKSTPTVTLADF